MTLLELLLAVALSAGILTPLVAWTVLSWQQQADAQETNYESFQLGLVNEFFPRDVASALTAASSTAPDGSARPAGQLKDCIGGAGAGGDVRLALILPGQRRVTYSLLDSSEPGKKDLWRRECPNLSEASDSTLNDVSLSAGLGVDRGQINPSTEGNEGTASQLVGRLASVDTSCPTAAGQDEDPLCRQVRLTARFADRPPRLEDRAGVVLQGTRRVNTYFPPGTKPIARFTMDPVSPERDKDVTFDATSSFNPRGGALQYLWDFGNGQTSAGSKLEVGFDALGARTVSLVVVNNEGTESEPFEVTFTVGPRTPDVEFLTPVPLDAIRTVAKTIELRFRSYESRLDSYQINWGDGSAITSSTSFPFCSGEIQSDRCGDVTLSHTYATAGYKQLRITVTDSQGNTSTRVASVKVESDIVHVSASAGVDDGDCGTAADPCRQISHAIGRAITDGKISVRVSGGSYNRFVARNGISVQGGFGQNWVSGAGATGSTTTTVTGGVDPAANLNGPTSLVADNISLPTVISDLTVVGSNAAAGQPSYAVVARNSSSALSFERVTINAGNGGSGSNGANGSSATQSAAAGGNPGQNSEERGSVCSTERKNGGTGAGGGGTGGAGGSQDTRCSAWVWELNLNATAGLGGGAGSGGGGGGGAGGSSSGSGNAGNGAPGAAGGAGNDHGAAPAASGSAGTLSNGVWAPASASTGKSPIGTPTPGRPGGGGGGGGASDASNDDMGGGGGGGGAGGAAAPAAGTGGKAGNASIGMFLVNASPTLVDVVINRGNGGAAGAGGKGGFGQPGGPGGAGGKGRCNGNTGYSGYPFGNCSTGGHGGAGGNGGAGGRGGHSGAGSGGAGGPSIGIARVGTSAPSGAPAYNGGAGGPGGAGGTDGVPAPAGPSGPVYGSVAL